MSLWNSLIHCFPRMHTEETESARVKLRKYKTLIWTSWVAGRKATSSKLDAGEAVVLASCWDITRRISFVVFEGS